MMYSVPTARVMDCMKSVQMTLDIPPFTVYNVEANPSTGMLAHSGTCDELCSMSAGARSTSGR